MLLIESIASYTGESHRNIKAIIDDSTKDLIAGIVLNKCDSNEVEPGLLLKLIEMDVFRVENGKLLPNTAIFFENDIEMFRESVFTIGRELAEVIKVSGNGLMGHSPDVRNFIGSIIGSGQGLHRVFKNSGFASTWESKTGPYARSKIDFNQDCAALKLFGEDLQLKKIHRGNQYTGVVIGAGENNYLSNLFGIHTPSGDANKGMFYSGLATHLTDSLPLAIRGIVSNQGLLEVGKNANINVDSKDIVITKENHQLNRQIIAGITEACSDYFFEQKKMDLIIELLQATTVGKTGVPIANMMMNFWRYLRKTTAISLYSNGYLSDTVPTNGSVTVFYENELDYFGM